MFLHHSARKLDDVFFFQAEEKKLLTLNHAAEDDGPTSMSIMVPHVFVHDSVSKFFAAKYKHKRFMV